MTMIKHQCEGCGDECNCTGDEWCEMCSVCSDQERAFDRDVDPGDEDQFEGVDPDEDTNDYYWD